MRGLQSALSGAVSGIRGDLDALQARLDVLSTEWTGEASAAYVAAQSEWNASMARLERVLQSASGLAGSAVDRHLEARERVAALWK
ncbi:WXG100 family type VII secretion target [Microbacterium halimionae]|uniref:WXG100 family type VII secretion target n=2 Tax=Microbacterium halimionae TaxID=1526413 RepID=A0A7W3PKP3_9MICO|nr:WXG100 family type VII secretion target [Microbacterium halimionae]NII94170.1 WXG100 family type VII secretion target [Microbacterium halimionae]